MSREQNLKIINRMKWRKDTMLFMEGYTPSYLNSLDDNELEFLTKFLEDFYFGPDSGRGKRRSQTEVMASQQVVYEAIDETNPETLLLLRERLSATSTSTKKPRARRNRQFSALAK